MPIFQHIPTAQLKILNSDEYRKWLYLSVNFASNAYGTVQTNFQFQERKKKDDLEGLQLT